MNDGTEREALPTVVIGAGVVGLAIAFRLARRGDDVILVDRAEPGMAASFGNAGHIATEQVFPLASPSTLLKAPKLMFGRNRPLSVRGAYALGVLPWLARFAWASRPSAFRRGTAALASLQSQALDSFQSLCDDAGMPQQLHRRGHLILVENPRLVAQAEAQMRAFAEFDIHSKWLAPDEVAVLAPELVENAGAILVTGSGHVSSPIDVCDRLLDAFTAAGGKFARDEVRHIGRRSDGGFRLGLSDGERMAGRVVIAAGAWSRRLAAQTGHDVPLDTERGYHVEATGWRGSFDIAVASLDRMTIMTPLDGGLRITGFVELGGLDLPPKRARLDTLNRHLSELLPNENLDPRSEWMGYRPSMPDHLPVIGACPEDPNLLYAFGHQHLGLTLAGITADAIGALAKGEEPPVDLNPFRIDRF